jgi:hypothetical protein
MWPKQAVGVCGSDVIHHAVCTWSGGTNEVWYWRGIINDSLGSMSWASMPGGLPIMIDPVSAGISAVVEAQGSDVYIIMAKHRFSQTNADLVYHRSTNCGLTWGPAVNVTGFTDADPEGLWTEVGAAFDEGGEIHAIYNTAPADGSDAPVNLYHWSPSTGIRLITSAYWTPSCPCPECSIVVGGAGNGNVALAEPNLSVKPAGLHGIAEELLVAVWTQYGPTETDCSATFGGASGGFVNGEIYLSVSSDDGLTWDRPTNITGTKSPDCLPGDCYSESWVSAAATADSGIYLSYVEDKHPGVAAVGEGAWTVNPYTLLAVETRLPVAEPVIAAFPRQFQELQADPVTGTSQYVDLVVQNTGPATLNFTANVAPDQGGQAHVTVNGTGQYAGSIPPGGAPALLQIQFNTAGLPDPSEYQWRVEITSNDPTNDPGQGGLPIAVDLQVFAASDWNTCQTDTLSTGLHRMQISSCLEMGANGKLVTGFFQYADSSEWLVSGSPVVTFVDNTGDTLTYSNAHMTTSDRSRSENRSFRAQSPMTVVRDSLLSIGATQFLADVAWGSASTTDSLIGLDYSVVFPKSAELQRGAYWQLHMYNRSQTSLAGLTYGVVADLTAPPLDSIAQGIGSYQTGWIGVQGGGLDSIFTGNSNRVALFQIDSLSPCFRSAGSAAQVLDNAFYLRPYGQYHPDSLHKLFTTFGALAAWDTAFHPDVGQPAGNASVILIQAHDIDLGPQDTICWSYGIAVSDVSRADLQSTIDAIRLASDPSVTDCCPILLPGDVNSSGGLTSADIILLVNYVFKSGPCPLPCCANGNVNCDAHVTSADVIFLINYVFKNGLSPCDICQSSPLVCEP